MGPLSHYIVKPVAFDIRVKLGSVGSPHTVERPQNRSDALLVVERRERLFTVIRRETHVIVWMPVLTCKYRIHGISHGSIYHFVYPAGSLHRERTCLVEVVLNIDNQQRFAHFYHLASVFYRNARNKKSDRFRRFEFLCLPLGFNETDPNNLLFSPRLYLLNSLESLPPVNCSTWLMLTRTITA